MGEPMLRTGIAELYRRMQQANTIADEAIADYEESKARLYAGKDRAQRLVDKAADHELQHLGNRAAFWTARASRLALTLLVEIELGKGAGR